ncbi:type III-A CRISPR-associated RAMP protein Csm3 [Methylovulum psychrotolerans]|uniref:CRISPR system Cms endoribonuclease Csm3 n=1 Tax=Methylovulum psychrotolerans TaxID=1704499 RepID=A0A2S5CIM2_9GAMM|nr:type III-A CRISPR-associated RAMP protein Csm3 [Methylovulum psychrotolerans]POZ50607.1 CRISPR type III-associated RAMP protein Csm3 [Methylovulum psychrotolerans]
MSDTNTAPKISKKIFIRGTITALTGLHIGGSSVAMSIGGADKVVVRNPLTNEPYIPGSSLRGKMRSLLERVRGKESETGNGSGGFSCELTADNKLKADAGKNPATDLGKLFGVSAAENNKETNKSPTRLIVRDAHLTRESKIRLENAPNTDMPMTEVKTEVNIDRITAAANPRQFERVPAGAVFQFEFILTLLEGDDDAVFLNLVREGMELMQNDSLGGHGSRGYGQVEFTVQTLQERTAENYRNGKPATERENDNDRFAVFSKAPAPQAA